MPLAGDFLSGAHRVRLNPVDGQIYVAGCDGWQSYARQNGSLERLRYVGGPLHFPTAIEAHENGLVVRFNCQLEPQSIDLKNVFCQQWNYLYSKAYGSAEFSVRNRGRRGHDSVDVRSIHLLDDGRSVFVEIPHLHPVMQFHLHMRLATSEGEPFSPDVYYSLFKLRQPFTDFSDYTPIVRKKRYPEFPIAEDYPRDERLVAQEILGKSQGVVSLEVVAEPGLRFSPRRLRVPPGRRIGLTFKNTDVSMPHNIVLVTPERVDPIGEGAMLLAADPRAIAKHYVPEDSGVLGFSPILWPGDQYTVYFDSPKEKGAYPFACSFPGHWRVMRGTLYVADEADELPAEPETPVRSFVKEWKLADLAAAAASLRGRSFERGLEMFHVDRLRQSAIASLASERSSAPICQKSTNVSKARSFSSRFLNLPTKSTSSIKPMSSHPRQEKRSLACSSKRTRPAVHLLSNPLQPEQVQVVPRDEIEELQATDQSTMPEGLLMTLTRDEILDLLAFIESGGDQSQPHFQP